MSNTLLHNLSHLSLLIVDGEDRETFLQGQLTNDVRDVTAGNSQLAGLCTPKGRMIANMRLIPGDNRYFILLPKDLADTVQKRLSMFILRAQVTISAASGDFSFFGLSGEKAAELLDETPASTDETLRANDGCSITRISGDLPRYLVIGSDDALSARKASLEENASCADDNQWQLDDIRAGLPLVLSETSEAFVPQMANMSLVNGVSFTKGCYTGQEVVARMQYLGKLKRRMYRVEINGDCPQPGTDLFSPESQSGQGAGKVVMSAPSGNGVCEALIVTEIANAESGNVKLVDADGPDVRFLDLPYAYSEKD